ncbi:hypothetical protein FE257_010430 [Aspergillus nanangensis]|uniref:RidA family protein n=1 Tax=Aspergillus nanangensis TaxID=2582783 RepID=A0AAD4CIP9_ASPNN|nr:hypothetical protein FE257_010430 [Aspergillus nanangensis]
MAMKQSINTVNVSSPLFSEATLHGGIVYCTGKVGRNLRTGELVSDDVAEQTTAAIRLLESVLHAAVSNISKILKVGFIP